MHISCQKESADLFAVYHNHKGKYNLLSAIF